MNHCAYVGIGSNAGDPANNLRRALHAIARAGTILRRSSIYRTEPWGKLDQPPFLNAVVLLQTKLAPRRLFETLREIERRLGREPGERWGPRTIDLDLLLYDDLTIDEEDLRVPHERLSERAFVLVPLAEIDARFVAARDALGEAELAGVVLVERPDARSAPEGRENVEPMSIDGATGVAERVRALAEFLSETDAVSVRIERENDTIELVRRASSAIEDPSAAVRSEPPLRVDTIKADLVGIFHLGRPAPVAGETLDGDRELGFIEALGIRTPVRSLGAGRIVTIAIDDGHPVEYGQPLFSVARG